MSSCFIYIGSTVIIFGDKSKQFFFAINNYISFFVMAFNIIFNFLFQIIISKETRFRNCGCKIIFSHMNTTIITTTFIKTFFPFTKRNFIITTDMITCRYFTQPIMDAIHNARHTFRFNIYWRIIIIKHKIKQFRIILFQIFPSSLHIIHIHTIIHKLIKNIIFIIDYILYALFLCLSDYLIFSNSLFLFGFFLIKANRTASFVSFAEIIKFNLMLTTHRTQWNIIITDIMSNPIYSFFNNSIFSYATIVKIIHQIIIQFFCVSLNCHPTHSTCNKITSISIEYKIPNTILVYFSVLLFIVLFIVLFIFLFHLINPNHFYPKATKGR